MNVTKLRQLLESCEEEGDGELPVYVSGAIDAGTPGEAYFFDKANGDGDAPKRVTLFTSTLGLDPEWSSHRDCLPTELGKLENLRLRGLITDAQYEELRKGYPTRSPG